MTLTDRSAGEGCPGLVLGIWVNHAQAFGNFTGWISDDWVWELDPIAANICHHILQETKVNRAAGLVVGLRDFSIMTLDCGSKWLNLHFAIA